MYIKSLTVQNFRNYKKPKFEFTPHTTAIVGQNAVGKSNILEAIQLFATGKSIKADREEELIRFGQESCHIEALVCHSRPVYPGGDRESAKASVSDQVEDSYQSLPSAPTGGGNDREKRGKNREGRGDDTIDDTKLAITVVKNPFGRITKQFKVNGVKRRRVDFVGNFASVLFSPEDLDLIVDSPSLRREYINNVLSQVDKEYRQRLSRYEHAIRRRNKVLYFIREGKAHGTDLVIWDHIIVESGQKLSAAREELFTALNGFNESFPQVHWQYDPHEISQEKLDMNRARDIDAAQTLSGPHRDDFAFYDSKRELSAYGSRGEQRMAVLALKLAELAFIASRLGERPVLLLDDIFSELDDAHRKTVLDLLGKQQTILTSTEEDYFPKRSKIEVIRL